ncbi:hypothetical protein JHK84_026838 [Glycine max]|nr:hypothetical protein JHK86_026727 [Glycine max]KAG5150366.1 hypothetical protein JHK84_026838 [Glycine max]
MDTNMAVACHQKIPFNQMMQFSGVQAIVENVASKTKIHLINLDIGCGVQCMALMQALAERQEEQVEILKITAIGLQGKTEPEKTGKRLVSFAESLNLPFLYKVVFVTSIIEIKVEQFGIEDNEAVAVYSPYMLRTMVSDSDSLEHLIRVMRKIRPSIMIILELEAKHHSPTFVNRFIEALFFYSAFSDCIETCMKQDYECRMRIEGILSEGIRNIVAMEDGERMVRNVKIDVWRRFFASSFRKQSQANPKQQNTGTSVTSLTLRGFKFGLPEEDEKEKGFRSKGMAFPPLYYHTLYWIFSKALECMKLCNRVWNSTNPPWDVLGEKK